ncbi:hypothetical protein BCR44DRAFT_267838 [Catenaria anguillulae PL171]|uniref:Rho-GAP domain-containing protein n=1 Tax=Catenaria anguillulae PL171 TaxID=765915 RepID=A0A1Y2HGJ6_9FUNG|nr:hypothetical protein BCR44DRAFT_267838 [Catenaria anguillulae PL171]
MDQYAADLRTANQQQFKNALRCMLQCLDLHRLSVLACILHVVQAVIAKANCNSMDGENLAKMLAPSMFAFGQVSSIDAYDWAILALTVIFAEKDITWWFLPVS